ncbi:MAG: hypothetical protein BWK79_04355 [Beggiatoa sp. IS2]|nr:MAG: hypothetical protein BWK79_04355 [Beggiatoa sp. IS2]
MTIITLQLTLTLKAPYLTQSAVPTDYGVDVSLAKNYAGRFYIPATLLIGKLRESWKELRKLQSPQFPVNIEQWLGNKSDPEKEENEPENTVEPKRKQLMIEDLVLVDTLKSTDKKHYRIRINPELGSVAKGAYIVTEKPFATGESITFQGDAYFLTADDEERDRIISCLKKGLQWISQLGANRTIGFGELLDVQVEPKQPSSAQTQTPLSKRTRYGLRLQPHAPFCLAERRVSGNLFRSNDTISGGTMKGILATMFPDELPKHFDDIRISHAFPSCKTTRSVRFPLSLVKVGEDYYDVALCETPVLFWEGEGENKRLSAPAFAMDWKSEGKVKKDFGWPAVKRELRVRTAIDSEKRRSQDEQLFAYEMILPTLPEETLDWLAYIDLSQVPANEQDDVAKKLQDLTAHCLLGLGKTKVVVDAHLVADQIEPYCSSQLTSRDGVWIITLQTPALLGDPQVELHQAYREIWKQLSQNSLEMVRFFATQTLAGGRYFWKRFQTHATCYQPYLLTDVGSVFVLKAVENQENDARKFIEQWFNSGLPLAESLLKRYELSSDLQTQWQQCPYLPQSGYGEIAVNLSVHWDLRPQKEGIVNL